MANEITSFIFDRENEIAEKNKKIDRNIINHGDGLSEMSYDYFEELIKDELKNNPYYKKMIK